MRPTTVGHDHQVGNAGKVRRGSDLDCCPIKCAQPKNAEMLAKVKMGGLENVFRSILTAQHWDGSTLIAFVDVLRIFRVNDRLQLDMQTQWLHHPAKPDPGPGQMRLWCCALDG
jgi:hypothetical protein